MGFAIWAISLVTVNKQLDSATTNPLLISAGMAYVFWGIGWALARIADMIYYMI